MKQTKITKSARGENCAFRFPGICNHNNETTVFCHINTKYKGVGMKSPDLFGAYGCSSCHDALDGRNPLPLAYPVQDQWVLDAMVETQYKVMEKGLICIS